MAHVVVFGDSITYGAWDMEGGWVQRLRTFLEEKEPREHIVYNLGVSGDTTKEILDRFNSEFKARVEEGWGDTTIIISVGANDSAVEVKADRPVIPPEKYLKNLGKLIRDAKKLAKNVIFLGLTPVDGSRVNPIPWAPDKAYKNEDVEMYNEVAKSVCRESGVKFVDVFSKLSEKDLEDGVHPNSEGHRKIFEAVKNAM